MTEQKRPQILEGFETADGSYIKRRLIISLEGPEKNGKTHFSLTAPGPIAFINFDIGHEGVIEKVIPEKKVFIQHYRRKNEMSPDDWIELWEFDPGESVVVTIAGGWSDTVVTDDFGYYRIDRPVHDTNLVPGTTITAEVISEFTKELVMAAATIARLT